MNKTAIYTFFKSKNFELIEDTVSKSFGDYCIIFSSGIIDLRFVSDKSIESIDVRSAGGKENWYDIALIKALVEKKKDFLTASGIQELMRFFEKELDLIHDLFNSENYKITKNLLDELKKERMKQMFPGYKE